MTCLTTYYLMAPLPTSADFTSADFCRLASSTAYFCRLQMSFTAGASFLPMSFPLPLSITMGVPAGSNSFLYLLFSMVPLDVQMTTTKVLFVRVYGSECDGWIRLFQPWEDAHRSLVFSGGSHHFSPVYLFCPVDAFVLGGG
eukprot:4961606-Pleurochrysis_carterae.AAC.1